MDTKPRDYTSDTLLDKWGAIGDKFKWFDIHLVRIRAGWRPNLETIPPTHYWTNGEL